MSQDKNRQEKLERLTLQLKKDRSELNKVFYSEKNTKEWSDASFSFIPPVYYRLRLRWNIFTLLEKEKKKYGQTTFENLKRKFNTRISTFKQNVKKRIRSIFRRK